MSPTATLEADLDTAPAETGATVQIPVLAPVLTGVQFQGDVAIVPVGLIPPRIEWPLFREFDAPEIAPARTVWGSYPIPPEGVQVVRGESGGNTHLLLAEGPCEWAANPRAGRRADDLDIGRLTVPEGATALLTHPEHGYVGIGPGDYMLRRQRQFTPGDARPQFVAD